MKSAACIAASRLGVKDQMFLDLIDKLAKSEIKIGKPMFLPAGGVHAEPFFMLYGTMNGEKFDVCVSGPAVLSLDLPFEVAPK
jgi:hypothetical protein